MRFTRRSAIGAISVGCLSAGNAMAGRPRTGPVDDGFFHEIDGAKHWVRVRGDDLANPMILYLHGGPGASASLSTWVLFQALGLEKTFTIVYWDQPGAGRTFEAAGKVIPPGVTQASIAADGCRIAEAMRRRYGKSKLVLVGGSWGSAIGLRMALERPDLFHAYVGTAQAVSKPQGEVIGYRRVLAEARARGDEKAISDLVKSGPPPYASVQPFLVQRKWASAYEPMNGAMSFSAAATRAGLTKAENDLWLEGFIASDRYFVGAKFDGDWTRFEACDLGRTFRTPMFFFHGADDNIAPAELVEAYANWIRAPRKLYVAIPGGGHNVSLRDPRFVELLNQHVRGLAL